MERLEFVTRVAIDENGKVSSKLDIEKASKVDIDLLSRMLKVTKQNEVRYQGEVDKFLISNGEQKPSGGDDATPAPGSEDETSETANIPSEDNIDNNKTE